MLSTPGLRAAVLLLISNLAGLALAGVVPKSLSRHCVTNGGWRRVVRTATVLLTVALPFWTWALYKVVATGDSDYGAVTFLLVIAACASILRGARSLDAPAYFKGALGRAAAVTRWSRLVAGATGLLAANYALVLLLIDGLPSTFQLYLALGACYWTVAGVLCWRALAALYASLAEQETDHAVNVLEAFG